MNLKITLLLLSCLLPACPFARAFPVSDQGDGTFKNPVLWADVPDPSVIRVNDTYYMVSTTMHMTPGIPVMRSTDLVNWEIINYCYAEIDHGDAYSLKNGKNDYANGSWASNIRYDKHLKRFFVITACNSTNKSYIFSTDKIDGGAWHCSAVDKCYDPGLLFEDTGSATKRYVFFGQGEHFVREILVDPNTFDATLGPLKPWKKVCNFENPPEGLHSEGAAGFKIGDYYYLFMIQGQGWQRQEIVWRGKDINDPDSWEIRKVFVGNIKGKDGRDFLPSTGIAQGGIVDTPEGKWYAMLFQDYGSVGRIPVLIPVKWTADGWPVIGNNGQSVDDILPMPSKAQALKTNIVESDEFDNGAIRHIFSAQETGTGVTAGLSVEKINELLSKTTSSQNLFQNGDLESDSVAPWIVNGGDQLAKLSIQPQPGGGHVLKVSERKHTIAGPAQRLDGKLEPGATYRVSARVRYDDYTDAAGRKIVVVPERDFKITAVFGGGHFGDVAIQRVSKGQWATITGSYTVPANANVANAAIYVETTWVPLGDPTTEANEKDHTFDFLVGDLSLTKDEFTGVIAKNEYGYNGSNLKLQWQWNHNPNNNLWSFTDRPDYLRLKSGLLAHTIRDARNTLTQRTFGPMSSATTSIDVSRMKDGDVAGIAAFQNQYGFVGAKMEGGKRSLIMQRARKKDDAVGEVIATVPLAENIVFLRVNCDFGSDKKDKATFAYSLDNKTWKPIGDTLQMVYDWPDFMGYRYALFYYSTKELGGCVDFDFFHVSDRIAALK